MRSIKLEHDGPPSARSLARKLATELPRSRPILVPQQKPPVGKPAAFRNARGSETQARDGTGLSVALRRCFRVLLPAPGVLLADLVVVVDGRAIAGAGNGAWLGGQPGRGDRLLALFDDAAFLFHDCKDSIRSISRQLKVGVDNLPFVV